MPPKGRKKIDVSTNRKIKEYVTIVSPSSKSKRKVISPIAEGKVESVHEHNAFVIEHKSVYGIGADVLVK